MTGRVESTLTCDRETRPPVDGIRTICGEQLVFRGSLEGARQVAREAGWVHAGQHDYCPLHKPGRRDG